MKKTKYRLFAALLAVMLCVTAFPTTAFAYDGDLSDAAETSEFEETTEATEALTPDGNLTLVDDTESGDKEFITVQTRDGNTFYLIIDRASDEDNVYFLNLVDEEDLLALIDDENFVSEYKNGAADTEDIGLEETTTPEPEVTAEPKASEAKSSGPLLVIVLIMLLAGGAAVWFFKFRKPKPSAKGPADLDDYDFGEDEEYETETEDEPEPESSDAEDNPGVGDTEQ